MRQHGEALIVGAGPAGLAVAQCLKRYRVAFDLVDSCGRIGGAYARMHGAIELASPARYTVLPNSPNSFQETYITAGRYLQYLKEYAEHHGLSAEQNAVVKVVRADANFSVTLVNAEVRQYGVVVLAGGVYNFPVWPGFPVDSAMPPVHARDWQGAHRYRDQRVLIVGAATSGVEIAEACAAQAREVLVSTRDGKVRMMPRTFLGRDVHDFLVPLGRMPRLFTQWYCRRRHTDPAIDRGFANWRRRGLIRVLGPVEGLRGSCARFADGQQETIDAIICATGYRYDLSVLDPALVTPAGGSACRDLYFLGRPCGYNVRSQYLWGIAHDAQTVAWSIKRGVGRT